MSRNVVIPTDPLVGTGDTLVVNCTLENTGPLNINSSTIFFKFGNTRLDAKYVHVMDKNTAQLRMPNMTRSQNSGHIFCYAVEYPVKPHITECRVYNWQKMVCRWEPASQDTGIATNQTLYWSLL
ncbi:hypothetical protein NP493_297g01023 [Ridgeia piscesae]|uniref:Ig-like domain-containing protein n=1 Tax=Ridgeia piscesae TaxID=27915 RepID=A0AAD9NWH7_RIDPI|nr:hypothetical protein NP493_297g01023 [Ridgeia piscesae]